MLVSALALQAQSDDTHAPLECRGNIPKEFTVSSSSKYQASAKSIMRKGQKQHEVKAQDQFELESNFALDNLLRSGIVLFNDEVSEYLAAVAKTLLDAKPLSGKKAIKAYALRSAAVNAFATERGEVFVTLGLVAQLENEAQLAYVIAHELAHVEKKHVINFYLESKRLDRTQGRSILGRAATDDNLLRKAAYSKESEHEADRLGLERILASKYRTATLPVVFEMLQYSYLPFDDLPFERSLLHSAHYQLPNDYWLETVKAIGGELADEDDERSSHPSLKSRRQAMLNTLAKHPDTPDRQDYLVSAERFERVRSLARHELPMLYLQEDRHADAIYTAGLLLKEHPNDLYLKKCIAKALYLHAKLTNSKDYEYEGDYEQVEGESQQLYYLLEKLNAREATVLAWQYAWNLHREHLADKELKGLVKDLFFEFRREHGDFSQFSDSASSPHAPAPPPPPTDTASKPADKTNRSKYDRIREQKASASNEYWRHAFAGQLNDELFLQYQNEAEARNKEWKELEHYANSAKGKKENKRIQKKGYSLGIPKVVIVNPFYLKLDERKHETVQYLDTEEGQSRLSSIIKEVSALSDLQVAILDVHDLKENQTEKFNDIRYLNEWFSEQAQHYDLSLTPGNQQDRIDAIAQKYGTDYFLWMGVISLREKISANDLVSATVLTAVFPPFAPIAAYQLLKPKYEMLYFAILYDVRTSRRQVLKMTTFGQRDSNALIKAHTYDTFVQIKRKG